MEVEKYIPDIEWKKKPYTESDVAGCVKIERDTMNLDSTDYAAYIVCDLAAITILDAYEYFRVKCFVKDVFGT